VRRLGDHSARPAEKPEGQLYPDRPAAHRAAEKGQVVGTIDFQLNGKSIEQRPLIVMEAVEEGGFFSRMWDFVMMKFHGWFGSWFS
jgi:D-alanyl-D-alanine carboxypeptidase